MRKGNSWRFNNSLKILEFTGICMENHASVTWWQFFFLIQMPLTFGGSCNRYFWNIQLKILRLTNFDMLFQLVLTKFFKSELFSSLPNVDHVLAVMQRAYEKKASLFVLSLSLKLNEGFPLEWKKGKKWLLKFKTYLNMSLSMPF